MREHTFSESEDARVEMHNPNIEIGTRNNDSQQESIIRDESLPSQDDSHVLLIVKSGTGNPYSKLDNLINIFWI